MTKNNIDKIKEYFWTGGKIVSGLALKIYGNSIESVTENAFLDAIEIGIENTIAALYDANNSDDEIVRALVKYWGISKEEAEKRLIHEKMQSPIRELIHYMKMQGFSSVEIDQFIKTNKVSIKIRHQNDIRDLRHKPEKLMKVVQEMK